MAEKELADAMGLTDLSEHVDDGEGVELTPEYEAVTDPKVDKVDLSQLRGAALAEKNKKIEEEGSDNELANLAELVPDIKNRRRMSEDNAEGEVGEEVSIERAEKLSSKSGAGSTGARRQSSLKNSNHQFKRNESMRAQESKDMDDSSRKVASPGDNANEAYQAEDEASSGPRGMSSSSGGSFDDYPDSDLVLGDEGGVDAVEEKVPKEFLNMSSAHSISTATQTMGTHEVRMAMYLPNFKPATGCTNASDFIVRCFVARLRSGITVVKHGRSRWCKSRLRVLHIHPDGRSLSWKPAEGEPASSRRPPKLDLSTCLEVRHAWSPDPQNPMYTGTQILRQKCEAANAHKSFALIFKSRTVDITAVTADQCKVLMEGFSALCFRLQVANMAGRAGASRGNQARPMPEEDGVSLTASATLTNTSTPKAR